MQKVYTFEVMDKVPISFEHKGKKYSGYFTKVAGSGSAGTFHLTVDGYHVGQLLNTERGWKFYSNSTPELSEMEEFFGDFITASYQ